MGPTDIKTPASGLFAIKDAGLFIVNLFNIVMILGMILCLAMLMWGGIDWLISQGDKANYEKARNKITYAVIGLVIIAAVWLLWRLILYFFGVGETTDKDVIFRFGM